MHMAQTGAFGPEVVNANIAIDGSSARVELVRGPPPNQTFVLTFKHSRRAASRYFDIEGGEGTTPADVARLGRAIDEAFEAAPFQECVRRLSHPLRVQPTIVSKPRTIAVIVGTGAALAGGLLLLWGSTPPHRPGRFGA